MENVKRKTVFTVNFIIFLLFITLMPSGLCAQDAISGKEVDAVWAKSDGIRHEIFYSRSLNEEWSEPEMLTDDYYDNLYPVVDKDSHGNRWIFWSAYDNGSMSIRYISGTQNNWSDIETLSTETKSNIAPSVIIDDKDKIWLVWSANNGELDDIYYAVFENGEWSEPALLHATNTVADVLPTIELTDSGVPLVTWQRMQDGKYVSIYSEWNGEKWSEAKEVEEKEVSENQTGNVPEDIVQIPSFIDNGGLVFFRVY